MDRNETIVWSVAIVASLVFMLGVSGCVYHGNANCQTTKREMVKAGKADVAALMTCGI